MDKDRKRQGKNRTHGKESQKKIKLSQRHENGFLPVTTEQRCTYIALAYLYRFEEPAKDHWLEEVHVLAKELDCEVSSVTRVWQMLLDFNDVEAATCSAEHTGCPTKLAPDNPG